MIVEPRVRGFLCTTAHAAGCAEVVRRQAAYVRCRPLSRSGPKRALILGASMGYGLASRIVLAFGCSAATVGVLLERPASGTRTATAGWYATAAFHRLARGAGLHATSLNADAFSDETKSRVVKAIREDLGTVDVVVYSVAAPRRRLSDGRIVRSSLKPIGAAHRTKSLDADKGEITRVVLEPASQEEIADTVAVMGGADWELWIDALLAGGALSPGALTLAYSYLGPELTRPLYRQGTIGRAKDHLESTANRLDERLRRFGGRALIAVNKAVVTQSSSAIPVVPLYMSLLFSVMKQKGLHEGCIEQMHRLAAAWLCAEEPIPLDDKGRLRLDDREMSSEVQDEVERRWQLVTSENLAQLADVEGYRRDFLELFGFGVEGVDYRTAVEAQVDID